MKGRPIRLPAPYLKRVWLDQSRVPDAAAYPFCLPFLNNGFELDFDHAITIIVGENGTGKIDAARRHRGARRIRRSGRRQGLSAGRSFARPGSNGRFDCPRRCARAWLPKITNGWFFRAESFFSVARYLDDGCARCRRGRPPDFLSHSHGEGFLRFFEERCQRQGIFIFDEPELALSPSRQIEFLKLLRRMDKSGICQVIMATHAPMLMAYPAAQLLRLSKYGLEPVRVSETDHYRLMREFCADPQTFIDTVLSD